MRIVPERPVARLLTTGDAAKELAITTRAVLKLAHQGDLPFERTRGGQLIFHCAAVDRFNLQRAHTRSLHRSVVLTAIHLRMAKAGVEPQQLSFLRGIGLRIIARGERPVRDREPKVARCFEEPRGSDKPSSVNRKVAGSRR